jgi:nucleotide-binding universal stress UspA family protein
MLVPRTYRWDQYEFHRDLSLETVPRVDRVRRVGPQSRLGIPLEAKGNRVGQESPEDYYLGSSETSSKWTYLYQERRTLWRPSHISAVVSHPAKILYLRSAKKDLPSHPLLETISDHYQSQLKRASVDASDSNSVPSALKIIAGGSFDLIVLDRDNLKWAGAILKEVSEPILVLPTQWKVEGFPKNLLVPVEGTTFSYAALAQAVILGEDFGSQIQLFEVSEKKDQALGHLIERMAWKKLTHDFFQAMGDITKAIREFSQVQNIGLIVMSTHAASPGSTFFGHSITLEVLREIDLPLWVVHPETG